MTKPLVAALCFAVLTALALPAAATTGKGCLSVTNVAGNDALNLRARPSADARIVDVIPPEVQGVLHLDGPCAPKSASWSSRWCPVTYYSGRRTSKGWVKARFVRDSECP